MNKTLRWTLVATLLVIAATVCSADEPSTKPSDELSRKQFIQVVRPILAKRCFACHGPDGEAREAELRLDDRASAIASNAFVAGDPDGSELISRVMSKDADVRMPPEGEPLTEDEVHALRTWIANGAPYAQHWAFLKPLSSAPPQTSDPWVRNPIDAFVLAKLHDAEMKPSPQASRRQLARRVHLDLIGVAPSMAQLQAFLNDRRPNAYERMADRLLSSPMYGERWATPWLDLARYADTNGYEKDRQRSIWPYRDWVIKALNDDLAYDQFTIEQLAGDMLESPTVSQRVATGFHRNTMINEEGGIDPLEYRFYAMVDRVSTTGIVWMGLTTGCAQCHSHKYDPISHRDYYSMMALLDNADEPEMAVDDPRTATARKRVAEEILRLENELPTKFPASKGQTNEQAFDDAFSQWATKLHDSLADWRILKPAHMQTNLPRLELLQDGSIVSTGDITKRDEYELRFDLEAVAAVDKSPITALRLEVLPDDGLPARGPGRAYYEGRKGDFFLSEWSGQLLLDDQHPADVAFDKPTHTYGKLSIGSGSADAANVLDGNGSTGWSTSGQEGRPNQLVLPLAKPLPPRGVLVIRMLFERHFAASLGRFRISQTTSAADRLVARKLPVELEATMRIPAKQWSAEQRNAARREFALTAPQLAEARKSLDAQRRRLPAPPRTLVMQERPADNPRVTRIRHRGEYLSEKETAPASIPEFLKSGEGPRNRLAFARWLVSKENPLAARVTVNRAWRHFWGAGLVRTSGDFGTQSNPPTHPRLLDYLAVDLVENNWSIKRLHRMIVTSAAYQQASMRDTAAGVGQDPSNTLLGRGPRARLDAEQLRDHVFHAAGMLSTKLGGPSVYPPQPASVMALAYGGAKWPTSQGEDRYRRSLYTFRKRTAPFAAFAVFDGPSGEICTARRDRSNTPLQALTLLNDPMYMEAFRALARADAETPDRSVRLRKLFLRVLTRPPTARESVTLLKYWQRQRDRFESGELDAKPMKASDSEDAAWLLLARVVMNLDEAISKP